MKTLTPQERVEQEIASLQVLRDNAGNDHKFEFEGLDLVIYKDVFSPSYFNGWRTFTPPLRKRIVEGMDFLEIGVGSGITSLLLARDGARVSASDISPLAVENTKINAEKNNIKLERVLLSDVYDGFRAQYKFDVVYWNAPWMETIEHDKIDGLLGYGLFDNDYSCLERFVKQTHLYLKPNGKLYLGHADFGDYKRLESLLDKYGYQYKVIADEQSLEIRDVEFYLYEAQLKGKQNKIFIPLVYIDDDIMEKKKADYCKLAEKYNLKILESSFEIIDKDAENIMNRITVEIDKAQVLIVDLSESSIKTGIEIAYACQERSIPVIGFGDNHRKPILWAKEYFAGLVSDIERAFEFSTKFIKNR